MKNLASINDPEDLVTKQYVDESLEIQISNEEPTNEKIILWVDEDAPDLPAVTPEKGESAYEIAVRNGFKGTEQEWLGSLEGPAGKDGMNGKNGVNGQDGHTPVKGQDYWTTEDRRNMVNDVLAALPAWTGGAY